ncbi:hypothetical protein VTJ49DRAFT_2274 [Mycothermus thermophilus]|uniref:Uncharacterized protein n=1 Tax=Humicola insolens TaxID=85995 RepID=A0ABR3VA49_HUMIN
MQGTNAWQGLTLRHGLTRTTRRLLGALFVEGARWRVLGEDGAGAEQGGAEREERADHGGETVSMRGMEIEEALRHEARTERARQISGRALHTPSGCGFSKVGWSWNAVGLLGCSRRVVAGNDQMVETTTVGRTMRCLGWSEVDGVRINTNYVERAKRKKG